MRTSRPMAEPGYRFAAAGVAPRVYPVAYQQAVGALPVEEQSMVTRSALIGAAGGLVVGIVAALATRGRAIRPDGVALAGGAALLGAVLAGGSVAASYQFQKSAGVTPVV